MDAKQLVEALGISKYNTFELVSSSLLESDELRLHIYLRTIKSERQAGIIIRFLEDNVEIFNEIIMESICKNIEVDDQRFDEIIPELRDISYQILNFILNEATFKNRITKAGKMVHMDWLIKANLDFFFDTKLFVDQVKQLVDNIEKRDIDYSNYSESLILLGSIGKNAAIILQEQGIATYKRSHGGYLLTFKSEKITMSNKAIIAFKELLSATGVPVYAAILEFVHYSWQE